MNRREFLKRTAALTAISFLDPMVLISGQENSAMAIEKQKWWQKTIVYQIYPISFFDSDANGSGDIEGITQHLDYIKSLGVGAIWLTPIYCSPLVDNGYDVIDYTKISPEYGSMEDFDNLVAEAKKRSIKIVMDLVFNHSSSQCDWFIESKSSRNNSKSDWYIWRDAKSDGSPPTNWRSIFGGSAWEWCNSRKQFYLHTFNPKQPDLNWENPEVRRALYNAANFWIDKGVGGFRIDAIPYIKKPIEFKDGKPDGKDGMVNIHSVTVNSPGILDFLHEFKREVFDGHDIFTVGEANGVSANELNKWVGSDGVFDMLFEFSHVALALKNGEIWCRPTEWKLSELKKAISDSQEATRNNGWYPIFFENHDQPRCVNHFFAREADPIKAAKVMATVLLTLRGTPFIYQGQELGITNVDRDSIDEYDDITSQFQYDFAIQEGFTERQALDFVHYFSRDNARTPMQWNDQRNAGFSRIRPWLPVNKNYKTVNVATEEKDENSVLTWYKKLSKFRSENQELIAGNYELLLPDSEEIFAFKRKLNNKELITIANFSLNSVTLPNELASKKILIDSESVKTGRILKPLEARICRG